MPIRVRIQTHPYNPSSKDNQDSSRKEAVVEAVEAEVEEAAMVLELIHSPMPHSSLYRPRYKKLHIAVEEVDVEEEAAGGEEAVQSVFLSGWLLVAVNLVGS
jgi:hypothetical protein